MRKFTTAAAAALIGLAGAASAETVIVVGANLILPPQNYIAPGETIIIENDTSSTIVVNSRGEGAISWSTGELASGASVSLTIKEDYQMEFYVDDESDRQANLVFGTYSIEFAQD